MIDKYIENLVLNLTDNNINSFIQDINKITILEFFLIFVSFLFYFYLFVKKILYIEAKKFEDFDIFESCSS